LPPPPPTPPDERFRIRRFLSLSTCGPQCLLPLRRPALPRGFRPLLPALGSLTRHLRKVNRKSVQLHVTGTALHRQISRLLWPRLTSARPSVRLATHLASRQSDRPPGVRRVTFAPYTRRIYARPVRVAFGLRVSSPSRPPVGRLICGSCS
jgi:hypothetical protein